MPGRQASSLIRVCTTPGPGAFQMQPIDVSHISVSPPSLSLKAMKIGPRVRIKILESCEEYPYI